MGNSLAQDLTAVGSSLQRGAGAKAEGGVWISLSEARRQLACAPGTIAAYRKRGVLSEKVTEATWGRRVEVLQADVTRLAMQRRRR